MDSNYVRRAKIAIEDIARADVDKFHKLDQLKDLIAFVKKERKAVKRNG